MNVKKPSLLASLGEINLEDISESAATKHGINEITGSDNNQEQEEENVTTSSQKSIKETKYPMKPNNKPRKGKGKLDISANIDLESFMSSDSRKNILLEEDVYNMLQEIKRKRRIKIKPFVNEILRQVLQNM